MLPEPTLPKRAAPAPAEPEPAVMVPLFCVPDDPDPGTVAVPGRRATRSSGRSRRTSPIASPRPNPRGPAGRTGRASRGTAAASGPGKEPSDLLTVTAELLRRALARSFLRHGIPGDPEAAVHAAMNVVEPVLQARDTEILRLRRLMTAKLPGR